MVKKFIANLKIEKLTCVCEIQREWKKLYSKFRSLLIKQKSKETWTNVRGLLSIFLGYVLFVRDIRNILFMFLLELAFLGKKLVETLLHVV